MKRFLRMSFDSSSILFLIPIARIESISSFTSKVNSKIHVGRVRGPSKINLGRLGVPSPRSKRGNIGVPYIFDSPRAKLSDFAALQLREHRRDY